MSKFLVTGTAGFIGFHLANALLKRGEEVVGLDNISDYYDINLKYARLQEAGIERDEVGWNRFSQSSKYPAYRFVRMNLEDKEHILQIFITEKFDYVVHLAAQAGVRFSMENPNAYINSNITGFISILEGCRNSNIRHLVYASSSSVYGNNTKMPLSTSDNVDHPISLYAVTKKCNELMAHSYSHLFRFPSTGLRFFTVYGPWGRPDMSLFLFTKAILEDQPIKVFNNGKMVRDFTYIDDIIEGIIYVIGKPSQAVNNGLPDVSCSRSAPYKVYNIGNSSPVQLMDYISAIEKHLGKIAVKEFLCMQSGDVPQTEADMTELVKDFGYKPNTPVLVGIGKFIDWYKKYSNTHLIIK